MPDSADVVDRPTIKTRVVLALAKASGKALSPGSPTIEGRRLDQDLGMKEDAKRSLKKPFNKITQKYDGYIVFYGECVNLATVKDAIDLVYRRANGRKP